MTASLHCARCTGNSGVAEPGFEHTAAVVKQTTRGQHTPQPVRISVPRAGEIHALGSAQQPGAVNANVVYDAAPTPGHHSLPPVPPPHQGLVGGNAFGGGSGGVSAQPVGAGYGAAFNNAPMNSGGAAATPAADGLAGHPTGAGLTDAAAVQWAHSALAAGYMSGGGAGASALGGYAPAAPAGGSVYSGSTRPGSTAVPAGAVVPNGVILRPSPANGFASGASANGLAGYAGSSPAAAAATAVGGLIPQQLHQAAAGQGLQQHHQQQHADAAATLVAEHLEAAHRAYKAGRHLEALQLCNTVRDCRRIGLGQTCINCMSALVVQCGMQMTDIPLVLPRTPCKCHVLADHLLQMQCSGSWCGICVVQLQPW